MKRTYKIDSRFYFILLLHYKYFFLTINLEDILEEFQNNRNKFSFDSKETNMTAIKIDLLLKCVGSAIFNKNNNRYYARTEDVFDLITSFDYLKKKCSLPELNSILVENLKTYKNEIKYEIFNQFLADNNFYKAYLKKEKKNIVWFINHHQKKTSGTGRK